MVLVHGQRKLSNRKKSFLRVTPLSQASRTEATPPTGALCAVFGKWLKSIYPRMLHHTFTCKLKHECYRQLLCHHPNFRPRLILYAIQPYRTSLRDTIQIMQTHWRRWVGYKASGLEARAQCWSEVVVAVGTCPKCRKPKSRPQQQRAAYLLSSPPLLVGTCMVVVL